MFVPSRISAFQNFGQAADEYRVEGDFCCDWGDNLNVREVKKMLGVLCNQEKNVDSVGEGRSRIKAARQTHRGLAHDACHVVGMSGDTDHMIMQCWGGPPPPLSLSGPVGGGGSTTMTA